jgi:hypothetical protein
VCNVRAFSGRPIGDANNAGGDLMVGSDTV